MPRSLWLSAIAASHLTFAGAAVLALESPLAAGLPESAQRGLEAIAELPPELRQAALACARHPEFLVRVPSWRSDFDARLAGLLFGQSADARSRLEQLAAHPDLVAALLSLSEPALEEALATYPADLQQSARDALLGEQEQLEALHELQERCAVRAGAALAELAPDARSACEHVLDEPGTAALLLDHLRAAQVLAVAHTFDSAGTDAELDRIQRELEHERELEAEAQAAREQAALEAAARAEERRRWRSWRHHWGYGHTTHPYDVYTGGRCDPWAWGWHRRWRDCW